jgi:hypothetical protein
LTELPCEEGELRETAYGEESLENKFSPRVRWRGETIDGSDSFSFLDRENIERLQNISADLAPKELGRKRDISTRWLDRKSIEKLQNISAHEELKWRSEKRHKYLLNLYVGVFICYPEWLEWVGCWNEL